MVRKQTKKQKEESKLRKSARKFKLEFKKALGTAILAALGFLIALVWRDVITEYVDSLVALSPIGGKLISALIVTLVAVIGILIVTKILVVEE